MALTALEEIREANELLAWLRDQSIPARDASSNEEHAALIAGVEARYVELMKARPELMELQQKLALAVSDATEDPTEDNLAVAGTLTAHQNLLWREAIIEVENLEEQEGATP